MSVSDFTNDTCLLLVETAGSMFQRSSRNDKDREKTCWMREYGIKTENPNGLDNGKKMVKYQFFIINCPKFPAFIKIVIFIL